MRPVKIPINHLRSVWHCFIYSILFIIISELTAPVCVAQVSRLELEGNRSSTIYNLPITVEAKAFDAVNNPVDTFNVNFDIVEGASGGTLGANEDCEGEPAGSQHCVTYSPPATLGVYHIRGTLVSDPSISAQWEIEAVECPPYPADGSMLNCSGPIVSTSFDHKGDLRIAVILLEPQDFQSASEIERENFRDQQTDRFFGSGNSVKRWFTENAIGEAQLIGDADDVYGPYVLNRDWDSYFQPNGQLRWSDGHGLCFQIEGAALADPDVDYSKYNRVYFVVRGDVSHNVWGWTNGIFNKQMGEGCIQVTSARDGSMSPWQVAAHEYSHTLHMPQGMGWTPDLYGGADPRKLGSYDIMDNHMSGSQHSLPIKWAGEWVPSIDQFVMPRPMGSEEKDETVVIGASEIIETDPNIYKTIIIPITDRKKTFVEARQTIAGLVGDQNLPDDGVLITDWTPNPSILGEDRAQILLLGRLLAIGDEYDDQDPVDPTRRLNISLTDISGDNYTVRVRWQQFRADPYIRPWEPPPWESVDIWNDSPLNNEGGSIIYADADGSGNPRGRGDEPSYGVTNTLYARIHNGGNQDATGVVANFYWVDPAIGDPPWNYIGSDTVDISAGTSSVASVPWIPISNPAHQCVKVIINPYPGELNPSNNSAQENFHVQESPSGSPFQPAKMSIKVNNPFDEPTFVQLGFNALPKGWRIAISHSYVHLAAHETKDVLVTITPPKEMRDKRPQSLISIFGEAYQETHAKMEMMIPIGGVSILTRGVDPVPPLKLSGDPSEVFLGDKIKMRVYAFPLTGRPVAIIFQSPTGQEEILVGRTDSNRVYETDFFPSTTGRWTSQARFMGDNSYAPSESLPVEFIVKSKQIPSDPQECRYLCPRDYAILVLIVILLVAILILLIFARSRIFKTD